MKSWEVSRRLRVVPLDGLGSGFHNSFPTKVSTTTGRETSARRTVSASVSRSHEAVRCDVLRGVYLVAVDVEVSRASGEKRGTNVFRSASSLDLSSVTPSDPGRVERFH